MSTRRKPAKRQKGRCVRYGRSALRRAMREGALCLEAIAPVYDADAAQYEAERGLWLRRARDARRAAVILRAAAAKQPA